MNSADVSKFQSPDLSLATIRLQLDRLIASRTLARATYLGRLLKCCVELTLSGHSCQLKELWLGTNVFHRKGRFNPARDPIVRVQARRLRQKLNDYYRTEGLLDKVRITLPVGSYVPVFSTANPIKWAAFRDGRSYSVAVLPLQPLDTDAASEQFADSVTAELTQALFSPDGPEVISRTSASAYKGVARDIREIGKDLSADFIVEGYTRLCDNYHRITLQLTATDTGYHCWAAWFEQRNHASVPDARGIAQILRTELSTNIVRPHLHAAAHMTGASPSFAN